MSATALPKAANALRELGRFQDIPVVRQLGVFVLAAAAIALGLWLFFWTQKPDDVMVQAGLDAKSTAEASDALRTSQIPFKLDPASGALTVPADQAGAARMALASAGIAAANPAGYESLQGDQGFGTSQFVENARYQHAMEIELARTITQLRPVREARVHLAMPKPSAFTRQNEPASASVVLQLNAGQTLEQNQIDAIERLVASSVSDLSPERVTVVDQFGRLLSQDDPTSEEAVSNKQFEQQRRQEAMYVQRIEELLAPMTGAGRVSAKVSVDMDFAQTEQASETYGPQPAIVRSEQLSESGTLSPSNANAQGVPGSASNTPTPANTASPAAPANGGGARVEPGDVRVPYISATVRDQIRDDLKSEVMAQAKAEGWAAPNETPEWTKRIRIEGDMRVRNESRFYSSGNSNEITDWNQLNASGPYDINKIPTKIILIC